MPSLREFIDRVAHERSVRLWTVIGGVAGAIGLVLTVVLLLTSGPTQSQPSATPILRAPSDVPATTATTTAAPNESINPSSTSEDLASSPSPEETIASGPAGPTYLVDASVVGARFRQFYSANDASFVGFKTGIIESGGETFDHSIFHSSLDKGKEAYVEYNLSRSYSSLSLQAVVSDSAPTSATVRFEVYLDDKLAKRVDVGFGKPTAVVVATSGALRLRLSLLRLDDASPYYDAGWAEAALTR